MTVLKRALLAVCIIFAGSWLGAATAQQDDGTRRTFEVEALNIGLLPAPQIDRETPQAAVESFLFHSRGGDFDRAAHLLDLSRIDPARQSEIGPMLARQLDEFIDRKVWIDWNELPDRPDGLDPSAGSNDPLAGEPRRSIRLALIDLDGRPVPIRLSRLKPPDGDPVWLFSAQTVDNVPALHAKYGATAFERGLPGWAKGTVLAGLALWEVVFLPLLLATAALLGFGLYRAAKGIGKRLQPGVTGELAAALAVPLSLIASGALALSATGTLFVFSVSIDTFVKPLLLFLLLGGALLILVRIIDVVIEHGLTEDVADLEKPDNESTRDFQTNLSAFRRIGLVIVLIFFIGLVFTQMNLLATTGLALVGSAGILTLVLAFAARSALSNIMASLQIALSKAATIGDSVLFEGQWSYVEKINFTFVQLKTWDNRRLIVPVTYFVSEPFENWTKRDPSLTKVFELRLNHMADVDVLRDRFRTFVDENDKAIDKDSAKVLVIGQDASGMLVRFYATAADPTSAWYMHCELREAMLRAATDLEIGAREGRRFLPAEREVKVEDITEAAAARGRQQATRAEEKRS
jgi:MscS family membrane protein